MADRSAHEIEITAEMIKAGIKEFWSFDPRFEPDDIAVIRIFLAMLRVGQLGAQRVRLASEVGAVLTPYLDRKEDTLLHSKTQSEGCHPT